jgi:hypothetical protein
MFWLDDAPLSLGCTGPLPNNMQPSTDAKTLCRWQSAFRPWADRKFFEIIEPERAEET